MYQRSIKRTKSAVDYVTRPSSALRQERAGSHLSELNGEKYMGERLTRDVELIARREISYLQATVYCFVYHINTRALYCQEKSTLLKNENKRIGNPRKKNRRVRWRTQDENMR